MLHRALEGVRSIPRCPPLVEARRTGFGPVLGIDPGQTVGLALLYGSCIDLGQCEPSALWEILGSILPETIVIERYKVRPGQPGNPIALEVIGRVREYVAANLYEQDPAQGKGFWNNDKLKAYGLYVPGLPHARDALRHLMYHLTFREKAIDLRQING